MHANFIGRLHNLLSQGEKFMLAPAVSVVATINCHNCYQNIKLLRDESTYKQTRIIIFSSIYSITFMKQKDH